MKHGLCSVALFALAASAAAQPPSLPATKLTIQPAPVARPALKYLLLPELRDTSSGNAAYLYQRAHSPELVTRVLRSPQYTQSFDWLEVPLKDFPLKKAQDFLPRAALREVDLAARREYCDWDLTDRLKKDGISLLLPDVQEFRNFAAFLALRARIELAEKKFDKALYTFQTGFSLGKDVANAPTLIHALVGVAIDGVMVRQVEEMIQTPGSPNLYWALTSLPRPLISLRKPLQGEKLWLDVEFPEFRTIETVPLTVQQQQSLLDRIDRIYMLSYEGGAQQARWTRRLATIGIAMKVYPAAKRALIAQGFRPESVEALPVLQVVAIQALRQFREHEDDMYKWFNFPYRQARKHLAESRLRLQKARRALDTLPFLLDLLPAVSRVSFAQVRLDRRIAALRCVEAVRLYAAAHDGKLPATLAAISEVPIPLDPVTGNDFLYKADDDKATLYGPPPGQEQPSSVNTVSYQLTLKR
jgi:hypothetical protein